MQKVVVTELKNDTFYAVIWMEQDGEVVSLDARPSDALALALRSGLSDLRQRRGHYPDCQAGAQHGGDDAPEEPLPLAGRTPTTRTSAATRCN